MTVKHIAIAHPQFDQYAVMCMDTPELVQNFNRLYKTNVSFCRKTRSGLEAPIDQSCGLDSFGNDQKEFMAFMDFVSDTFLRIPELQDDFAVVAHALLSAQKAEDAPA